MLKRVQYPFRIYDTFFNEVTLHLNKAETVCIYVTVVIPDWVFNIIYSKEASV